MGYYHTCKGCKFEGQCQEREMLRQALKSLRVTSVKHVCKWRAPIYRPGDPVKATLKIYDEHDGCDQTFKAWFIRQKSGQSAIVFIPPGSLSEEFGEDWPFEPRARGYVRCTYDRLRAGDHEPRMVCPVCREVPSITGDQAAHCNSSVCYRPRGCLSGKATFAPSKDRGAGR